jgi:hypothetical protein
MRAMLLRRFRCRKNRLREKADCERPCALRRLATQLTSRGRWSDDEPQKAYMRPRSAAAPGSACLTWRAEPVGTADPR